MSFLVSKPASLAAGSSVELTLDRSNLDSQVSSDAYFSDSSNWKRVVFYYFDATGFQKSAVIFDSVGATMTGTFSVSSRAKKNTWQLYKVVVEDFDGGKLVILRDVIGSSDDIPVV